jgi:ribulose-phosphate 3-epimerase
MKSDIQILPSLLAADTGRLAAGVQSAVAAGADGLHVDIMDAHFVPNLSFGPNVVAMAREQGDVYLSVHLMMDNPDKYLRPFIEAGADLLMIHIEADYPVRNSLRDIRSLGIKSGITINPDTPAAAIYHLVDEELVDEVLVMSVHPGFGGQSFIPEVLPKIAAIRTRYPELDISIDGGINLENCVTAAEHGANVFIAGTTLYGADDMRAAIAEMRAKCAAAAGRD